MSYKKIISFINGENEAGSNIVAKAERCCHAGADEIFLYNYSKIEEDREDFLTTLRQVAGAIDIPFFVGMYIGRFEDAKKALYTGAEKLVIKYDILPEQEVLSEIIARFGSDRLMLEIDAGKEFESIDMGIDTLLIKHVDVSGALEKRLEKTKKNVIIRDSLLRNDLENLMQLTKIEGVATNYYENKNIYKVKKILKESGVPVATFESAVDFSEFKLDENGLIPCIVQDYKTSEVLMLAYMNQESFEATCNTGKMTYYSRSRKELWCKGETSGHFQYVKELSLDCDKDTILAKVHQVGAACHTGKRSCFFTELAKKDYNDTNPLTVLSDVMGVILDRKKNPKEGSYTNYLFDKGIDKILKKCGEEATEIVIAAKNPDAEELKYEISDFLYHMMVLMAECNVSWDDVMKELSRR